MIMGWNTLGCMSVAVTLVATSLAAPVGAQPRGLAPSDFYAEVGVGQVAVSPAGDLLAFTVTTIDEASNERHREIWMQPLRGGRPDGEATRYTDPTTDASSPRWAPDGRVLSFRSRRGDDANDIWFARVTAPGGEAYHIDGVTAAPVWSRDGEWIAFTHAAATGADSEDADTNRDGWIAPDAITTTLDASRFDGRVITSMRYKRDGTLTLLPHRSAEAMTQLVVVPASGGAPLSLTSLPFDVSDPAWSGDGSQIFFVGDEQQHDELSADVTQDLYVVPRDGGEPRKLTSNPGSEFAPAVSPSGEQLAFLYRRDRGSPTDLKIVDLHPNGTFAGPPRTLTNEWNLVPGRPTWTRDGAAVRFEAGAGGNRHLFEVTVRGELIRQVTTGDRYVASVSTSIDGQVMAYTVSDAVTPAEVYTNRGDGSLQRKATSFNDGWLADITRQPAERLTWAVEDGTQIEGWLVAPVGFEPGGTYPMILKIHGGPHGAYGNTFFRTFHVLSASGFFVLYANPRGSTGYGHAYTYATRDAWGEMDAEDLLAGVDAALDAHPEIDASRLGVSGGSYGGFMTNWLTATTDRFAAAVTSRSIANWESWYGGTDVQWLTEHEFAGTPWEARDVYRRLSPISYVERVTAPTLVIHSENDYRTPIGDGEQWFMALKKRNVPTELVRYPRSSHGLSRTGEPWLLVDRLERLRSWFVHWLIDAPPATSVSR